MATGITTYPCPACGGPLHFVGESGKLECDYCESTYDVEYVEKLFAEKEQQSVEAQAKIDKQKEKEAAEAKELGIEWEDEETAGMKVYNCSACGAELICDASTAATCCPYCGNNTVIPSQFTGGLKPDLIIPFKLNKEKAIAALKKHYEGKKLLPKAFSDKNHIEEIQGVYVPFWLCDCQVEGSTSYDCRNVRTYKRGNYEITETDHFNVERGGKIGFEKIPVDASTKMPDAHMDAIEPYNYKDLKPFSTAYLPGFLADKYDVSRDDSMQRIESRAKRSASDELRKTVTGYNSISDADENLSVKNVEMKYALMPVWMLSTKWNGQNFLFAMNGQTGKLIGDLPIDKGKYWRYFATIALPLMAVILGFWFM